MPSILERIMASEWDFRPAARSRNSFSHL